MGRLMGSSELFFYLPIPKSVLVQPKESDFKIFADGTAEGRKEIHFSPFLNQIYFKVSLDVKEKQIQKI